MTTPNVHVSTACPASATNVHPHGRSIDRTVDMDIARPTTLTEKQWQSLVIDLARLRGWRIYHTNDSRRSEPGFPDLCLVRRGRLAFAELKTETGKITTAQHEWLADFSACPGLLVYVWRPSDWPEVQRVLR
jgi:hypothetical protein